VDEVLSLLAAEPRADMGIITIDRRGNIGVGHRSRAMPHAYCVSGKPSVVARMQV
jgi:isoaspartyl peptidase/L-asparaginase-like protein (Ntn-hydrolase superfamily)